jgi:hypothetical protein
MLANHELETINRRADLDFFTAYNRLYVDEEVHDDPYFGVKLSSNFNNIESLAALCAKQKSAVYLSLNVQSLLSKHEQLSLEIAELECKNVTIDAIALQETWDVKYTDLVPLKGFNPLIFKRRRDMRGGGVGFYIRNGISAEIIENLSPFENKIIEALTIRLTYPDSKIAYLTSIYRSNGALADTTPTQQLDRFMEKFALLLNELQALNKVSFVFLDANINLLNLQTPDSITYFNCILEKGYLQIISKATRMQNESKSLIDHVLTNSRGLDICSGTLISDVSDHFFTFVLPRTGLSHKHNHRSIITRDFSNQNMLEFRATLGDTNWDSVANKTNVDEAYEEFWNIYKELYNSKFPLKRIRFNKNKHKIHNFMTNGLLISRNRKKILHSASISDPSAQNKQLYKNYKTVYQRVIRGAKKLYFTSKLRDNAGNPKKTWQTLNEILGKSRSTESVKSLNINDVSSSNPAEIANHFNTFFTAVGQQISNNVPPVEKQPEDFINYGREIPDLLLQNTTPEHIKKIIKSLQPKMSTDAEGVSTKMIKYIGNEISSPLSHIFNLSLSTGIFPNKLKLCRVIPIFKSGNASECDNYRPISLLSSISKLLEKIVANRLVGHLIDNDLLYAHQYGFLPERSTEQNLLQIVNYITHALNEGNYCIGVFLDLKKAFDVCSHEILLKKLEKMGIRGTALTWFGNYLSGRTQFVDIDGEKSDALPIDISVIQGSILGPILFLCYINDFYAATSLFSVLFADDTTGLGKGKNLRDLTLYMTMTSLDHQHISRGEETESPSPLCIDLWVDTTTYLN